MRAVEITDATLADYGRRPRKDTWVLRVDLETFGLSHNPRFIEVVNRSWASYKKDGGGSLEEMRRRHGPGRKVNRRRKAR
jgi:hypothetical protein